MHVFVWALSWQLSKENFDFSFVNNSNEYWLILKWTLNATTNTYNFIELHFYIYIIFDNISVYVITPRQNKWIQFIMSNIKINMKIAKIWRQINFNVMLSVIRIAINESIAYVCLHQNNRKHFSCYINDGLLTLSLCTAKQYQKQ